MAACDSPEQKTWDPQAQAEAGRSSKRGGQLNEKNDRKKLDAAKAIGQRDQDQSSEAPEVLSKASVSPVVTMMITATILENGLRPIGGAG